MGRLAKLVDGIREKLGGGTAARREVAAACYDYDKVAKTDSMRVEIRSRRARQLVAKNLAAADAITGRGGGGKKKTKKRFLAF